MSDKFKKHFDSIAEEYDDDRGEFSQIEAMVLLGSCGKIKGGIILDIGTGTGIVALEFAKRIGKAGEVIGIDISESMLRRAKKKAEENDITNIKFDRGSFTNIRLKNESVDMIVSSAALHHVEPHNKPKAFREMWRVLKIGGRIVINDAMYENKEWRRIFIDRDLLREHLLKINFPKERMNMALGLTKTSVGLIGTFRDEYVESVDSIKKYAEEAGFKEIKIKPSYKPLPAHWILKAKKL